jgi:hypothetical protein
VTPPSESVFIRAGDTVVYNGSLSLPEAGTISIPDGNGVTHDVNANSVLALLYTLDQTASEFSISDLQYFDSFGSFYLKCITPNGGTPLCDNWQYAINDVTPSTGADTTILTGGESIVLYFGNPHQLLLDKTSINAGDSVNVTAQKYNYTDNTWSALLGVNIDVTVPNPDDIWNPTLISETLVDQDGKANIVLTNPGTYTFGIKEDFSFPSYAVTVVSSSGGGGGGGGGGPVKNTISIADASSFLSSKQKPDGSFGSSLYTDWSAVAIGALGSQAGSMKSAISDYLKNNPLNSNSLTDNERRAMALMSLGINPYDGTSVNYIDKIVKSYDGTQFGDSSLYNDDIFASIVLLNAGYSPSDEMIKKDIAFIISQQSFDGSWGSPDMTGAGLQLLRIVMNLSGVQDSITKAEAYLASAQGGDGGFLNSFSTSWALQGMSLNPSLSDKTARADKYIALLQETDGGVGPSTDTDENRIWATSYAIPASLHVPWSSVMQSFSKPSNSTGGGSGDNNQNTNTNIVLKNEPVKNLEEPKDKDLEVKKEPVVKKIVKNKKVVKKEEDKIANNALSASALGASSSEGVKPSIVSKFINLIKSPFVWLFMKFGF